MSNWVIVYSSVTASDVYARHNFLSEFGIESLVDEDRSMDSQNPTSRCKLLVPPGDRENAERLLAEMQKNIEYARTHPDSSGPWLTDSSDEDDDGVLDHFERPKCPKCKEPRTAVCPYCKTASNSFPPGDEVSAADGRTILMELPIVARDEQESTERNSDEQDNNVLLVCNMCDEPFTAEFLRRCEWCGHDFGNGTELPVTARRDNEISEWSPRMLIAVLLVAGLVIGTALFFKIALNNPPNGPAKTNNGTRNSSAVVVESIYL